ncbi:glutathione S-transferase protein [Teladorsagia circumcincta]|uniref:glutathione transferase n=1 Tax=Teladorsagia circumcincta TaxID=45464 RepID=A0A2G9TJF1_TELCI|nr:glutathione S-transferase protein [Teladorsagia circumcincta]
MVHYKLKYFDGRGLAEIVRQVLVVGGCDFEDVRYSFEEFPKHKEELPFGQVPVLEFDGKQLAQSHTIARYLARKFGYLVGDSLTWVDLLVADIATWSKKYPTLYDGFPEMKAHAEKIRSNATLKKWISSRPDTYF